jgi:flagellar hook assembly protein FlgD
MVANDKSRGVHNAKYAVALLYKSLGWTPLSVKELPGMPTEFALQQNYPNPFNPSTSIRFSVPKESRVKIEVYNIAGQLVKTLLDEALRAGNKEVVWDGTATTGAKVSSGMYLYRIQAGDFTSVKKMVMLK